MRISPIALLLLAHGLLLAATPVLAEEGLVLDPGQWKFDISITMPLQPKPILQSVQSCMDGSPLGPSELMPWAEDQGCKIKGVKLKQNKLTWKLICSMNGQLARGRGEFEGIGDHAAGKSKVSFEIAGRRMTFKTEWDAERVGACGPGTSGVPTSSTPHSTTEQVVP